MHLVVVRRNQIQLPAELPSSLILTKTPVETKHNSSLNSSKLNDLITDSDQHNHLIPNKANSAEPLSPQNKQWTKFNDSPTHQTVVVTTAASPPSTSSSAGIQTLANFDFNAASIVKDPKILHPVAVRLSPDGQSIRYDNNQVIHNLESGGHLASSMTDGLRYDLSDLSDLSIISDTLLTISSYIWQINQFDPWQEGPAPTTTTQTSEKSRQEFIAGLE